MQGPKETEKGTQEIQGETTRKHLGKEYIWTKSWRIREIGRESVMIVSKYNQGLEKYKLKCKIRKGMYQKHNIAKLCDRSSWVNPILEITELGMSSDSVPYLCSWMGIVFKSFPSGGKMRPTKKTTDKCFLRR